MELYIFGGMMSARAKSVVTLSDYLEVRKIISTYNEFDDCELELQMPLKITNTGLSIIDDVEFFLKHPLFRDNFEQVFLMHLKEFSSKHL